MHTLGKILLVEDELRVADFIIHGLAQQKIVCDHAANGKDAIMLFRMTEYDAIILDMMLPKISGWEVIKSFRQADQVMPILILSACDRVENRVNGLQAGADDYLVKPFAFSELLARLHVLTKRRHRPQSSQLTIGELSIDYTQHAVALKGTPLTLTDKEYKILVTLAQHPDRVFSRVILFERVWGIDYHHSSNVVDVTLYRLRQKLESLSNHPYIQTVRGVGYVFKTP